MVKATLSSKGQIVIPKAVRKRLNLATGTQVSIDISGESLVLKRVVSQFPEWRTMRGMVHGGRSMTAALARERALETAKDESR